MKARFLLAAAAAFLCGCSSIISDAFIDIDQTSYIFPAAGDIYSVEFTASAKWTAASDNTSWCRVAPSSGEPGKSTIRVTTTMNHEGGNERYAKVTISCGLAQKDLEIIQLEANTLKPEQEHLSSSDEGETFDVKIRHNVDFTVKVEDAAASWITASISPSSKAMKESIVHIEVMRNFGGPGRSGMVVLNSELGPKTIEVVQSGADVFALDKTTQAIPGQGGTFTVMVFGTMPYHINTIPDWISEIEENGRVHTFQANANESESSREGTIVFCDEGGTCIPLIVTQEGIPEWAAKEFRHQSLLMRFTATWCGWCPRMNKSVKKAQELYPGKIQHLAIHGGGSSLEFESAGPLETRYRISGFPTGIADGRIEIGNMDINSTANRIVEAAKETENLYGTVSGASIRTALDGGNLNVDATLYFTAPGSYLVTALIVEDDIVTAQSDYEEGDHPYYTHDGVARKALTSVEGDTFSQTGSFSSRDFSWSTKVDSKWKSSNLRVLIYVQAKYGNRVKKSTNNYGEYYVDNCFTVKAGETLELETE